MSTPRFGEIWWAEAQDKRRPVLIVTRSEAIPVLGWITVAPVTRRIRGIATEISLGPEEGLAVESAASFDNLQPLRRSLLTDFVGDLGLRQVEVCRALSAMAGC